MAERISITRCIWVLLCIGGGCHLDIINIVPLLGWEIVVLTPFSYMVLSIERPLLFLECLWHSASDHYIRWIRSTKEYGSLSCYEGIEKLCSYKSLQDDLFHWNPLIGEPSLQPLSRSHTLEQGPIFKIAIIYHGKMTMNLLSMTYAFPAVGKLNLQNSLAQCNFGCSWHWKFHHSVTRNTLDRRVFERRVSDNCLTSSTYKSMKIGWFAKLRSPR